MPSSFLVRSCYVVVLVTIRGAPSHVIVLFLSLVAECPQFFRASCCLYNSTSRGEPSIHVLVQESLLVCVSVSM